MNRIEEWALVYRCEYCGASAGNWCRTLTGGKSTALHGARVTPLHAAFAAGYMEHQEHSSLVVRPA